MAVIWAHTNNEVRGLEMYVGEKITFGGKDYVVWFVNSFGKDTYLGRKHSESGDMPVWYHCYGILETGKVSTSAKNAAIFTESYDGEIKILK